jgi:Ca2+:H+ antiporter
VLGASFLVGGLRYKEQVFKEAVGHANTGLLTLAATALILPSTMKMTGVDTDWTDDLVSSRLVSVILLINYVLYLVFQLKTYRARFVAKLLLFGHASWSLRTLAGV